MKKLIVTTLAVIGLASFASAQGTFVIDTSANSGDSATISSTSGGLVFYNGSLDTTHDVNLGILWGLSSSSVTTPLNIDSGGTAGYWSLTQSDTAGATDITFNGDGTINDPNGNSYAFTTATAGAQEPAGTVVWLDVQAWTGIATSYGAVTLTGANAGLEGQSGPFSITLALNSAFPQPDIHGMGSINLLAPVPEPTTLALAGLGGAALLAFRRRKA
jgi:hypothetical protein